MRVLRSLCRSASGQCACEELRKRGWEITQEEAGSVKAVLADVPLRPDPILHTLPKGTRVFGGKLVGSLPEGLDPIDLLQDPEFAARNADITARCALRLLSGYLTDTLPGLPVLVAGWGRIGKCLARYLRLLGADTLVYARKPEDRAILNALGYRGIDRQEMLKELPRIRVVFNTVPAPILSAADTRECSDVILIDLASAPGIEDSRVLTARGLPGAMAPAAAGRLIADTLARLWKEETE